MTKVQPGRVYLPAIAIFFGISGSLPGNALAAANNMVGAVGTIQSESGRIILAGPGGTTISEICVKQNSRVTRGEVLVRFADWPALNNALAAARIDREELAVDHRVDMLKHALADDKAEQSLARAHKSLASYLSLDAGARVGSILDDRRNAVADAKIALQEQEVDGQGLVSHYEEEVRRLQNRVQGAEIRLAAAELRAPIDGTVLAVRKHVGESATGDILVLANLLSLRVEADVFEGDLARIAVGDKATITSNTLGRTLAGHVESVGRQINAVRKTAKVRIRLDSSAVAEHYLGMEVNVTIAPD